MEWTDIYSQFVHKSVTCPPYYTNLLILWGGNGGRRENTLPPAGFTAGCLKCDCGGIEGCAPGGGGRGGLTGGMDVGGLGAYVDWE